ncbi:MAG: hypothetical protein ABSA04_08615 [Desulfobaccales bacterium]
MDNLVFLASKKLAPRAINNRRFLRNCRRLFHQRPFAGFIFGVAKPEEAAKKNVSTNLEQISEWLTKIIVGAGLAQLATLPGSLKEFGIYAKPLLGNLDYGEIFAIGILIYYLTCGFLGGYLLTKLFFLGLLEKDSNGSSNNTGKDDDKK